MHSTSVAMALGGAALILATRVPTVAAQASEREVTCAALEEYQWSPRCSTPGVRLEMKEAKRQGNGAEVVVILQPVVSGFPAGSILAVAVRAANRKAQTVAAGYATDSTGTVVCTDRNAYAELVASLRVEWCSRPWSDLRFVVANPRPAEPVYFTVYTIDTPHLGYRAYAGVIARPIGAAHNGCTVEAALVMPPFGYIIDGSGFRPSDTIRFETRSGQSVVTGVLVADSTGWLPPEYVMPSIRGKKGGQGTHQLVSSTCNVTLTYPWGAESR